MRLFKIMILFLALGFECFNAAGQANASLNILTLNNGQVNQGGIVEIQVTVGVTIGSGGQTGPIGVNKVRVQISVPTALVNILADVQQTGLPPGWIITSNTGSLINVCNGSDIIPLGAQRQILIKIQGNTVGGPSTINGSLAYGNGTSCTAFGTLAGDITSDNVSQSSIQVLPASSCVLTGVTASAGTIACNGGTTTLTAAATTSGTAALEYSLNGAAFQTSNTFTVSAGTYAIAAREVITPGCSATGPSVTVTQPPAVTAPVINTIVQTNCSTATGSVNLTGLPPGSWIINPGSIAGNTTTTTISSLAPGTYNYTVTNATGCTSPATADVIINTQPAIPAAPLTGSITQPTCAVSTGSVVLSALPSGSWTINPGNISGNTTTTVVNNLAAGIYNFTVTNTAGCTSTASADVVINDVPGAPSAPVVSIEQPSCTVATGVITVTSATTGLTFSLDGGPYTTYPANGYIVAAGLHTLTAQNASLCTSPVDNITINQQPVTPASPAVSIIQPTCTSATGIITITSGTGGLTFSLDGGTYAVYLAGGYTVTSGSHTLTAQSAGGCISAPVSINVDTQPPIPAVPLLSIVQPTCSVTSGTITITSATAGLTFSIDGGVFATYPASGYTAATGLHTVRAQNTSGCISAITSITVNGLPAPPIVSVSTGAIACNNGTTTLIVAASGGIAPLQYSLNAGTFQSANTFAVGAGTYTVTVRDANLCTGTAAPVTVTQPAILTTLITAPRITQCGGTTTVTVTASGGIAPFTGTGTFIKGPGTWNFPVTDAGGCTSAKEITIEAPGCMELKVYPNPARNVITINHSIAEPGSTMQVFDIHGALIKSKLVPQNTFLTTFDVSKLAAATYVLVYWNGNEKKQMLFEKVSY